MGRKSCIWNDGFRGFCATATWDLFKKGSGMRDQGSVWRGLLVVGAVLTATVAQAFQPIPKESARALGVTRGRPFSSGAVFINGKYIEPPYVVERWGTGIRINSIPVTGQIIAWSEFIRTQPTAKVTKTDPVPAPVVSAPVVTAPVAAPAPVDVDASSLDDLFDDDPKPAKKALPPVTKPVAVARPAPAKPTVSYSLTDDFVPNEATKRMLERINSTRTDIDRIVRAGGFICFGDTYSQVAGDARTLRELLAVLPEFLQNARDVQDFCAKVRDARLGYLNEVLRWDLYRNRADYRKLKGLRTKIEKDNELNDVLNSVSKPLF